MWPLSSGSSLPGVGRPPAAAGPCLGSGEAGRFRV